MPHDADREFTRHATELRAKLGTVGVWWSAPGTGPADGERAVAREIEALGYGTFWFGEAPMSKDIFAHAAIVLAATSSLTVASGIANMYSREGATAVSGAAALGEAFDDRFVLGLGVSHPRLAAAIGQDYRKPLPAMRAYLDAMDDAPYLGARPAGGVRRVLAALRPRMLELARDRAAGAHPYFVPVEHTQAARETLGSDPVLAPEQAFLLETDPGAARAAARAHTTSYLAMPNYTNNLLDFGFTAADFEDGGSDRLVDAIVAWGDVDAVTARVQAHLDAGADHVAIQPLSAAGTTEAGLAALRAVAPALTALGR